MMARPDPSPSHPDIEIVPAHDGWVVTARLPGVAAEEVAIDVDNAELTIHAAGAGGFRYCVSIPADVDVDTIYSTMDHGLLTVLLPCGRPTLVSPVSDVSEAVEADAPSTAVYGTPPVESGDGTAADESVLGPSPGSVVAP
jgi:HSP20 family protein